MATRKSNHGGKRAGAGRKATRPEMTPSRSNLIGTLQRLYDQANRPSSAALAAAAGCSRQTVMRLLMLAETPKTLVEIENLATALGAIVVAKSVGEPKVRGPWPS